MSSLIVVAPCHICNCTEAYSLPDWTHGALENFYCWCCHENRAVSVRRIVELVKEFGSWAKVNVFGKDILHVFYRGAYILVQDWIEARKAERKAQQEKASAVPAPIAATSKKLKDLNDIVTAMKNVTPDNVFRVPEEKPKKSNMIMRFVRHCVFLLF